MSKSVKLIDFSTFLCETFFKINNSTKKIYQNNPRLKLNAVIQFPRYENQNQEYRCLVCYF